MASLCKLDHIEFEDQVYSSRVSIQGNNFSGEPNYHLSEVRDGGFSGYDVVPLTRNWKIHINRDDFGEVMSLKSAERLEPVIVNEYQ